jgi:hypothetical protein
MGEHSPVDALVPSIVCEYAVVQSVEGAFEGGVTGVGGSVGVGGEEVGKEAGWERLHWEVDERIERECERAEVDARALITDSDDSGLWFNDYGADWIKDVGMSVYSSHPSTYSPSLSKTLPRRLRPNGPPTRMVQIPRRVHCDLRNGPYAYVRAWEDGDDSDVHC